MTFAGRWLRALLGVVLLSLGARILHAGVHGTYEDRQKQTQTEFRPEMAKHASGAREQSEEARPLEMQRPAKRASGSKAQAQMAIGASSLPPCDWPPPLYPRESLNASTVDPRLQRIQAFVDAHAEDIVAYLDAGAVLGLYRDGQLIASDGDVDLLYAWSGNRLVRNKFLGMHFENETTTDGNPLGFDPCVIVEDNDTADGQEECGSHELGENKINSALPNSPFAELTADEVRDVRNQTNFLRSVFEYIRSTVCMPPRGGMATHRHVRVEIEKNYGPMWFIKMPWKAVSDPRDLYKWAIHNSNASLSLEPSDTAESAHGGPYWRRSITAIRTGIDTNRDGTVTAAEVVRRVLKDGADPEQLRVQVSENDRCRAAKMLSWLLTFDERPSQIKCWWAPVFSEVDVGKTVRIEGDKVRLDGEQLAPEYLLWRDARHENCAGTIQSVQCQENGYDRVVLQNGQFFETPQEKIKQPGELHDGCLHDLPGLPKGVVYERRHVAYQSWGLHHRT